MNHRAARLLHPQTPASDPKVTQAIEDRLGKVEKVLDILSTNPLIAEAIHVAEQQIEQEAQARAEAEEQARHEQQKAQKEAEVAQLKARLKQLEEEGLSPEQVASSLGGGGG